VRHLGAPTTTETNHTSSPFLSLSDRDQPRALRHPRARRWVSARTCPRCGSRWGYSRARWWGLGALERAERRVSTNQNRLECLPASQNCKRKFKVL